MTRVSIVTPFLNPGPFFDECVASVLAQTRDDWELLLVDDGSTDGSTEVALCHAAAHPTKIRYLSHDGRQNRGASASRNLAARHAQGEYLAFLDADDVYLPRKLEVQVPVLDRHPDIAMVYGPTQYWYSWSGRPEDVQRDWVWRKFGAEPDTSLPPGRMLVQFLNDGGTVPCMGSVLVRRDALERVGGWEESFRRICTDQVFHAKVTLNFAVMIHDVVVDRYRQHENSSCQTVTRAGGMHAAFGTYLAWLESYVSAQPDVDPTVLAAARQARRRHRHPMMYRYGARLRRLASTRLPATVKHRLTWLQR
jgi:glycosyltransferase involved in cell wall biosynthesis